MRAFEWLLGRRRKEGLEAELEEAKRIIKRVEKEAKRVEKGKVKGARLFPAFRRLADLRSLEALAEGESLRDWAEA
ncbi:MAG: hypothetical protein DRK00_10610 [Thermoprotei archaeon]|nr:MAG: hypothetical protein DRK00_10610 [Thermoprotei archaeon]